MKELDPRDIYIIDSFPVYNCKKEVLNVGCGEGRIDWHLSQMEYNVLATDIKRYTLWKDEENLRYKHMNIFEPKMENKRSVVLCSETLEHLQDYKTALKNLLELTKVRLIITFPYKGWFFSPEHLHFWDDSGGKDCKDVHEFENLCKPYVVSITKIRTKPQDAPQKWVYALVIDKRQRWG